MNGAALNKDYCRGQCDNKRELCGATDDGIAQISDVGEAEVMLQQDEQFFNGQTDLDSRSSIHEIFLYIAIVFKFSYIG